MSGWLGVFSCLDSHQLPLHPAAAIALSPHPCLWFAQKPEPVLTLTADLYSLLLMDPPRRPPHPGESPSSTVSHLLRPGSLPSQTLRADQSRLTAPLRQVFVQTVPFAQILSFSHSCLENYSSLKTPLWELPLLSQENHCFLLQARTGPCPSPHQPTPHPRHALTSSARRLSLGLSPLSPELQVTPSTLNV